MDHHVMSNQPNRRNFLKQSALGGAALAGLPSLGLPQFAFASDKMSRIEALELLVLQRNREQRRVLKVISSTGVAGYADFPDLDYAPALGGVAKEHLIGANPFAVEAIWSKMRVAGVLCSHRTALDYALWDLVGRETGRPVYELLGGPVRDRIRIYYYGKPAKQQLENEDAWRDMGRQLAKQPGAVVKVDPWLNFERFIDKKAWENVVHERGGKIPTEENMAFNEMVFRCLREGAGDKLDLIHGGHGQCSAEGAIATCKRLEQYDLLWMEEPVAPTSSMDDMAKVASATTVPIATGENLQGLEDFTRLIDKRAASVLNLPPPNVGGLTEARKIATLAEMRGMQIAPHFFSYGPLCWVAMANLCMATPNVLILEANSLRENPSGPRSLNKNLFFKEPIKIDGYYFAPSGKPGLGYEYDEKFVVSRKRLG
ncbi:MAG: mandelate racemase/muconate lactonizing enzyme family protein [Rubripirellula sp.]|nr:mandelate racemase/muconate lactonizing enzyme family protein [Rubripirellula sp.]